MSTAREQPDALVVGAGPTGLTLAAQLQAMGATCRIIDRQPDRVHESRALAIQPRTLEVLRGLGVTEELVARGNDAVWVQLHAGGRGVRVRLFGLGLDDTAYPFLLFVPGRDRTDPGRPPGRWRRAGRAAAGAGRLPRRARRCQLHPALRRRPHRAGAHPLPGRLRRRGEYRAPRRRDPVPGSRLPADLRAGRPGGRRRLGGRCRPRLPRPGGPAVVLPAWPARQLAAARHGSRPAREGGEGAALAGGATSALRSVPGGRLRLRDPAWTTWFRLAHRHAARYRTGRVFLAGDAAHVHSPAGAQGMNTGIQDAWNLGWKLALVARGLATEALLDSYDAERRPVGRFVVRFTDRAFAVATSTNPILRAACTQLVPRVLPLALRLDRALAYGFRTVSQLSITYRHSPAVQDGHPTPRRGPKAGDRLPDARVARDGQICWLGEALAAPSYHLLLCGGPGDWGAGQLAAVRGRYREILAIHHLTREAAPGTLHDVDGQAVTRLGVEQAAHYLIRPDGHVGYRAAGTDLDGLQRHLAHWLPNPTPHPA